MLELIVNTIEPVFFEDSKILILGTMPSPKSRGFGFFYSHPQNRFWKTLAAVFNKKIPSTIDEKVYFLKETKVALWDVINSCKIEGASDSSIKEPIVNDINKVLLNSNIVRVFTTGKKALELYNKFCLENTNVKAEYLPSTSAANRGRYNDDVLLEEYKIIKKYIEEN